MNLTDPPVLLLIGLVILAVGFIVGRSLSAEPADTGDKQLEEQVLKAVNRAKDKVVKKAVNDVLTSFGERMASPVADVTITPATPPPATPKA